MNTPDYFYCETKRTLGFSSRESRRGRGKSHIRLSSRFWSLSLSAARTLGDFLFWYPRMLTTFSTLPDLCPLSVRVSAQLRDLYSIPPTDSADSSLYLNRMTSRDYPNVCQFTRHSELERYLDSADSLHHMNRRYVFLTNLHSLAD